MQTAAARASDVLVVVVGRQDGRGGSAAGSLGSPSRLLFAWITSGEFAFRRQTVIRAINKLLTCLHLRLIGVYNPNSDFLSGHEMISSGDKFDSPWILIDATSSAIHRVRDASALPFLLDQRI